MDTDKDYLTVQIQNLLLFLLWNCHKLVCHIITFWLGYFARLHGFMRDVPYASHVTAGPQNPTEQHSNGECKRQELEAPSSQTTSASHLDLNFPLPGEKGPSCLVKVRPPSELMLAHAAWCFWESDRGVSFTGVWGLGKLQSEWRTGSLRHPLRQSSTQRSGRWEVRTSENCHVCDLNL